MIKIIRNITPLLIVVFLCAISIFVVVKILSLQSFLDFRYYHEAVVTYIHGGNPYVRPIFPFPYPPFALIILLPFGYIPLVTAGKILLIISLFCLFFSVLLVMQAFHVSVRSFLGILVLALVINFFPTKYTLASGQINTLILVFVAIFVYFYSKNRKYFSGIALACAIALKLFPLLLIPYLFIARQWEVLKAIFVSLAIIFFITYIILPPHVVNTYFTLTLPVFLSTGGGQGYYDQSLSAFIARILQNPHIATPLARIIAGLVIPATYFLLWKYGGSTKKKLLSISILLILNVILNNFAWQHHYIWLLIPFLITFFYMQQMRLNYKYYIILGISYFLIAVNFRNPESVSTILLSNQLYGAILLYILVLQLIISKEKKLSAKDARYQVFK